MKRIGLIQQFHGEGNPNQEGMAAQHDLHDEVILDVQKGTVSFIVPADTPDDQVLERNALDRYIYCSLKLENGAELHLWVHEGAEGVDVRMLPAKPERASTPEPMTFHPILGMI